MKEKSIRIAAIIGICSLWILDVSEIVSGPLWNGFWEFDSEKSFHLALWVATVSFIYIAIKGK